MKDNLLYEAAINFSSRSIAVVSSLVLSWVIPQYFGAGGLGIFMIGLSITMGLGTVARVGLSTSLIRWGGKVKVEQGDEGIAKMFSQASICCLVLSIVLTISSLIVLFFLGYNGLVSNEVFWNYLPFLLSVPANSILFLAGAYYRVVMKAALAPYFETAGAIVITLIVGGLVVEVLDVSILGFSWAYFAANQVLLIGFCLLFFRNAKLISGLRLKDLCRLPHRKVEWTDSLGQFAKLDYINYFTQYGIIVLLGYYLTNEDVGVFSVCQKVAQLLSFIVLVFNSANVAKFSVLNARKDYEGMKNLSCEISFYMILLSLPLLLILGIFPSNMLAVFGDQFIVGEWVLIILCAGQFINVVTGVVGPMLSMTGNQKHLLIATIIALVVMLMMIFILVPQLELVGAALALTASLIIKNLSAYLLVRRKLGFFVLPQLSKLNLK